MIRQRLKELDIKITEIAEYLQFSRTTMYKFIEAYDSGDYGEINKRVLALFHYIDDNDLIDKRNVINFVLSKLTETKELGDDVSDKRLQEVSHLLTQNPDSEKSRFIMECCTKSSYDTLIHYMLEIEPILKKKRRTEAEKKLLEPYLRIVDIYTKNN